MLLAAIEATNFRNLIGKIEWGPRLNIIYGNNGQGKTNWLEAIHVLARTKSGSHSFWRTPRDSSRASYEWSSSRKRFTG
jgi:recombinational DNA repair ATPase RecF